VSVVVENESGLGLLTTGLYYNVTLSFVAVDSEDGGSPNGFSVNVQIAPNIETSDAPQAGVFGDSDSVQIAGVGDGHVFNTPTVSQLDTLVSGLSSGIQSAVESFLAGCYQDATGVTLSGVAITRNYTAFPSSQPVT
jgi:hypothetical protein